MSNIVERDIKSYLIERGGHLKPSSLGMRVRARNTIFIGTY